MVESKPDSAAQDLRFHAPWPQLQALAQSIDLDTADDIQHKHVPYGAPRPAPHGGGPGQGRPGHLLASAGGQPRHHPLCE